MKRKASSTSLDEIATSDYPSTRSDFKYGTAGFRMHADELPCVMYRVGIAAALLSCARGGRAVGVMITASHNAACDNGVKLAETDGGMIDATWEAHVTRIVNAQQSVAAAVDAVVAAEAIDVRARPRVAVGRDTRQSSAKLYGIVSRAVDVCAASYATNEEAKADEAVECVLGFGVICTPQLHWLVRAMNTADDDGAAWDESDKARYIDHLAARFEQCMRLLPAARGAKWRVHVDCAHGVGSLTLYELRRREAVAARLELVPHNEAGDGALNEACGAEFVQKQRRAPLGAPAAADAPETWASVDGDADRLVFAHFAPPAPMALVDGDRVACVLVDALSALAQGAGDALRLASRVTVRVVQTAYANGASTAYLRALPGVDVRIVATGVKHLHHAAAEAGVDIGVYFEANGHGTVLFSARLQQAAEAAAARSDDARLLASLASLANQAIGDAYADLLLVAVALARAGRATFAEALALYAELPSAMTTVRVADRLRVRTTADETRCTAPAALQPAIDAAVRRAGDGARAFVRPSGTEDVVRVYAEAATRDAVKQLTEDVEKAVKEACS